MFRRLFAARLAAVLLVLFWSVAPAARAQEALRMVYFDAFPPFSYMEDGAPRGLLVDAMDEACRRLGVVAVHQGLAWDQAQALVRDGLADGYVSVPTPERQAYALTGTAPVIVMETSLFTWTGNPRLPELRRVASLNELKDFAILDYRGDGWGAQHLSGMRPRLVPTMDDVLFLLDKRQGDVFAQIGLTTRRRVKELGLVGRIVEIPKSSVPAPPFVLCLGKSSPFAPRLAEFDATFQSMREDGTLKRLVAKYE